MFFTRLAELWMESIEGQVRGTTVRSYRFAISHAAKYLGEQELGTITAESLGRLEEKLQGEQKSYRSVRLIFNAVRLALGYAEEQGMIPSNPARHYTIRKESYRPARETEPATHTEIDSLLADYPPCHPYRIPILLMSRAGLRRGEVRGLTWDHVDLRQGTIRVMRQLIYHGREDYAFAPLRSKSLIRSVSISRELREELAT